MSVSETLTVKLTQDELLEKLRKSRDSQYFSKLRDEGRIIDVGSDVENPDGPMRTITGSPAVIRGLFPDL